MLIRVKDGYPKVGGMTVSAEWRDDIQVYYDAEHDVCIHLNAAIPVDDYQVINALCDGGLFARFTKKQRLAYRLYRANRAGEKP